MESVSFGKVSQHFCPWLEQWFSLIWTDSSIVCLIHYRWSHIYCSAAVPLADRGASRGTQRNNCLANGEKCPSSKMVNGSCEPGRTQKGKDNHWVSLENTHLWTVKILTFSFCFIGKVLLIWQLSKKGRYW